jgi:ribonuclease G
MWMRMKKILISVNPWQTRVAILREDRLQNIYFDSPRSENLERSFFKGIISKVLPGIQTAFVDIGQQRAGFLHISEVDRELALDRMNETVDFAENVGHQERHYNRQPPDISKIFKEGEAVLVQVSKEPVYEKGAKLTTCFTLPGRFIVLLPNIPRLAISKKIEDREERSRLKEIVLKHLPEGMGAIIRTSSDGAAEKALVQDIKYLVQTWATIQKNFERTEKVQKIYEDIPLMLQVVRDHLDDDVESVITDDKESRSKVYQFISNTAPEFVDRIRLYTGKQDLFEKYNLNQEINEALSHKVDLASGGSIIIETTQSMTVVDVNTGRNIGKSRQEDTILQTNLEAAEEVVRQLRLRNIGGLIVIDFIDMAVGAHRQKLFRFFEKTLKDRDKFQSVVLKVSEFGLVQMTRKRSGKTLVQQLTNACPTCSGLGFIKSIQTQVYQLLALIKQELASKKVSGALKLKLHPAAFEFITHDEYDAILHIEKSFGIKLTLESDDQLPVDRFEIK